MTLPWVYDDGGRAAAGYRGEAGDCGTRAIAIAAVLPYRWVYDRVAETSKRLDRRPSSPREGTSRLVMDDVLDEVGWVWTPTMGIGTGTTVRLRVGDLPDVPRLIARVSHHYCAVVDGTVRDTHDPCRAGTRAVYGYWTPFG